MNSELQIQIPEISLPSGAYRFPPRYESACVEDFSPKIIGRAVGIIEKGGGITVCGPVGCGKTHLLAALSRHFYGGSGDAFWYARSATIVQNLKDSIDSDWAPTDWKNRRCLAIDDLWAERETDFAISELSEIIAYRYDHSLPTWIATNANPGELPPCWERSTSRLEELNGPPLILSGKDRRRG